MVRAALIVLAIVLSVTSRPASAQSFYATIRGAVRDATGIIAGVTLTVTDERTGVARTTTTNDVGEYVFANTPPGQYTLTAELTGFKTFERRGLLLTVQQALVLDILLEIGIVTEQVIVTGETPTLGRASASVASTIDRAALENLPTTGRNPFLLSTTLASVVPLGTPFFTRMQDQNASSLLSIAGAPPRANTYLVDGVPITDLLNRAAIIPSQESLDEVSVQVSTYDASFGRNGGGVFNSTHRSGANQFRGSALFRHRPDWGLSDTFFASQIDAPRPDSYNNLWAGTAGGPIVRGRTYFFGSTEGYRTREIRESVLTLPTGLERSGDFSRSVDAQGRPIVIFDPLTTRPNPAAPGQFIRDPFPGNVIPEDRIDPVARSLMTMFPLPDTGQRATRTAPVSDVSNQATVRIDHVVTDQYRFSATGAWYGSTEPSPLFYDGLPSDPLLGDISREVWMLALNNVWAPGGQTVYEARYGYLSYKDDFLLPTFDVGSLGFPRNYVTALPASEFPAIVAASYNALGSTGSRRQRFPSHTINGAITRLAGRHTIKVGGDFRRLGLDLEELGTSGSYNFTRNYTQGPNPNVSSATSGDAIASLLLGLPSAGTVRIGTPFQFSALYYAGYVQDDLRLNPNVTLNLGLRYEYESGLGEANERFTVGFDRNRPFPVQPPGLDLRGGLMFAGVDGYPTQQSDPTRSRFGPRAGLSWSLNARTVVRGGYGLFWSPHQFQSPLETTFGTRGFSATSNYFGSADNGLTPCAGCQLANPFPNGLEQPQGSALGLLTGAGSDIHFNDQLRRSPYLHKYSIDVQRELPGALTVRAGYVGSRGGSLDVGGTNLNAAINHNQLDPAYQALGTALQQQVPNPFFGNVAFGAFSTQPTLARGQLLRPYPQFGNVYAHQVSAGRSRYDSLVLDARRRLHGGWGAEVNYTWSRTSDNIIGEQNAFSPPGPATQLVLNNYDLEAEYGRSLSDLPNRLNVTGIVELPFGEGRRWVTAPRLARSIVGGWTVTASGFLQSGFPVRVFQADINSGLFGSSQRPNVVPDADPYATSAGEYDPSCRCVPWLNPLAWTPAAPFTFGNAPRADPNVRTPARQVWNLAVQKAARTSQVTLTFRLEVINLFNSRDLAGPAMAFPQATFGQITASGGVPRTLQLMIRAAM